MATRTVLKTFLWFSASPLILLSHALEALNLWRFSHDLNICLAVVDSAPVVPPQYISVLVAAEDHRSALHPGIDTIAIVRALWVLISSAQLQGASTIEQQFVRVVTRAYGMSIARKIREQLLALMLARHRSKAAIGAAYLSVAFFGSGLWGLSSVARSSEVVEEGATRWFACFAIARLKYPEPLVPTSTWQWKFSRRVVYIEERMQWAANNRFKEAQKPRSGLLPPLSLRVRRNGKSA